MLNIAFSLLGGLILSWFGFDAVVQTGMKEVFDVTVSTTGYYFLFGALGAMKSVARLTGLGYGKQATEDLRIKLNKKK
jgi:hypothetical protein